MIRHHKKGFYETTDYNDCIINTILFKMTAGSYSPLICIIIKFGL